MKSIWEKDVFNCNTYSSEAQFRRESRVHQASLHDARELGRKDPERSRQADSRLGRLPDTAATWKKV